MGMKYFRENDHPKSCFNLGILYEIGLGTKKSISLASESYTKAYLNGFKKEKVFDALKRLNNEN